LADKPKTPPPPRKVQAPKKRSSTTGSGDRKLPLIAILVAAGALIAIAAVAFVAMGGSGGTDDTSVKNAMLVAGCTFKTAPAKAYKGGQIHVPEGTKITYTTYPPSGGPHYGTPAIWDFYTDPVEPRLLVHNQEHGGVILWWGTDVPESTVAKLRAFYDDSPVSMVGTPLASLGKKVAITAWTGDSARYGSDANYYGDGHAAVCPTFDEQAFKTFRDAYRGKGPEGIPMDTNQPGT
jgi:hypothetical protein